MHAMHQEVQPNPQAPPLPQLRFHLLRIVRAEVPRLAGRDAVLRIVHVRAAGPDGGVRLRGTGGSRHADQRPPSTRGTRCADIRPC